MKKDIKFMKITKKLLKQLPKTDLHVHLDGSMRINTILELAEKWKIDLPSTDPEKLRKKIIGEKANDLGEYLEGFDITLKVLQNEEGLHRGAYELAEDAAEENIRYTEIRFCPLLHTEEGLSLTTVSNAVLDGLAQAEKDFGIRTGVIFSGMRNMSPEISLRLASLATTYKNKGVVGFDLAGQEYNFPAKEHRTAFDLALKNNLNITIHAGEAYGSESIHQAIHYCGAHRIGHGTRLIEDGDLLNYVNDHRIPIEICLKSNIDTHTVSSYKEHPFPIFYDLGLRVTLNTDNRLVSNTNMTEEFMTAHKEFNFDYKKIKNLIINGFKSSFLPYRDKSLILSKILDEIEEIEKEYKSSNGKIDYEDKL